MAAMLLMCENVITALGEPVIGLLITIIKACVAGFPRRSGQLDNLLHSSRPEAESTPKIP